MLWFTAEYSEESSVDGVLAMVLAYNCEMLARHFIPFGRMRKKKEQIGPALNLVMFLSPAVLLGSLVAILFYFIFIFACLPIKRERGREGLSVRLCVHVYT